VADYKHRPIYNREEIFFSFPKLSDGPFDLESIRRLGKRDLEIRIDQAVPVRQSFIHCRTNIPIPFETIFPV